MDNRYAYVEVGKRCRWSTMCHFYNISQVVLLQLCLASRIGTRNVLGRNYLKRVNILVAFVPLAL
jgi:hypothetical protein